MEQEEISPLVLMTEYQKNVFDLIPISQRNEEKIDRKDSKVENYITKKKRIDRQVQQKKRSMRNMKSSRQTLMNTIQIVLHLSMKKN